MPTERSAAPCRLFVYLAHDGPRAVVLRRGPSDWVRLSLWHTDQDHFEHGQWMKCRVYERRADLAPDGALFAYFARGAPRGPDNPGADSWLALSRPPYFSALVLWFVGGTYATGGFFPAPGTFWHGYQDSPPDQGQLPPWLHVADNPPPYIDRTNNWTNRTVFINRLLRDDWRRVDAGPLETWERANRRGDFTLSMSEPTGNAPNQVLFSYAVRAEPGGQTISLGQATWADWDQRDRLILARDGRLLQWRESGPPRELFDFNPQLPAPEAAPDWARRWPELPPLRGKRGAGRG